jgi:subtilisin family serine protease
MVAHANNGTGIVGIAPDSKVLALKSCWPLTKGSIDAVCNSFTLALAINKAIALNVDILNLSLSGQQDPLLDQLIRKAIDKGIIVVAASEFSEQADNFPASMTNVIGVQTNEVSDSMAGIKQRISAPGTEILTTFPKSSYDFISGSSFSAAHISGMVALLLENNAELKTNEISKILKTTKISDLHRLF